MTSVARDWKGPADPREACYSTLYLLHVLACGKEQQKRKIDAGTQKSRKIEALKRSEDSRKKGAQKRRRRLERILLRKM